MSGMSRIFRDRSLLLRLQTSPVVEVWLLPRGSRAVGVVFIRATVTYWTGVSGGARSLFTPLTHRLTRPLLILDNTCHCWTLLIWESFSSHHSGQSEDTY